MKSERFIVLFCLCFCGLLFANAQAEQSLSNKQNKKIGILVAMEKEYSLLKNLFDNSSVIVIQCGMGKVNAAAGCIRLIREYKPDVIISIGCAGGNGNNISIGDVVVSKETVYHDVYCGDKLAFGQMNGMPCRFIADSLLIKRALQLDCQVIPGLIATGDWFVDSKEKMRDIVNHFPEVKAVDMESAAIAQICYMYQVRFISFRIISDIPLEDEHASQYYDFWEKASEDTFSLAKQYIGLLINL